MAATTSFSRCIVFSDTDSVGSTIQSGIDYTSGLVSGSGEDLYPSFQHVVTPTYDPDEFSRNRKNFDAVTIFSDGSRTARASGRADEDKWEMGWSYATSTERDVFIDWFDRVGRRHNWTLTDFESNTHTVRFVGDLGLEWRPAGSSGSYDIDMQLNEEID